MNSISPCVALCKLSEDDICIGCKRTIEEIINWRTYTDNQKKAVLARLESTEKIQLNSHSLVNRLIASSRLKSTVHEAMNGQTLGFSSLYKIRSHLSFYMGQRAQCGPVERAQRTESLVDRHSYSITPSLFIRDAEPLKNMPENGQSQKLKNYVLKSG